MIKTRKKSIFGLLLIFLFALVFASCVVPEDNDDKKYTVEDLDTKYTDELELKSSFENQLFVSKGIEEVRLLRLIDGDTTHFLDKNNQTLKIRYLGVNTPESTGKIAPWGKQASLFVKNKLENAYSIVIEAENVGQAPEVDTTGERYLGYIWYKSAENDKYRLLNLEIIENCFSYFTGDAQNLKYGDVMRSAYVDKSKMKLRVFGELDPNFDYDTTINEITIAELRNNYSSYSTGTKLRLVVRVVRVVGNSLYVEDIDDTTDEDTGITSRAGIFLYHSFVPNVGKYKPGQIIQFEAQASDDEAYGTQLVGPSKMRSIEANSEYTIKEIDNSVTTLMEYEGFVVKVNKFKVSRIGNVSDNGAYTIYGTLENGSELLVRVDADVSPKLTSSYIVVGQEYSVIGGVSKYINPFENNKVYYQIKLGNLEHDGIDDFKKINNN